MRVILLANHFRAGGISTYLLTLARGLKGAGHDPVIATSGGPLEEDARGFGVLHLTLKGLGLRSQLDPRLFWAACELARFVSAEKIELMHAQTRMAATIAAMASRMTGVPYITTCHGFFRPHLGRRLFGLWGRKTIAVSRPVESHLLRDFGLPKNRVFCVPNGIDAGVFLPAVLAERLRLRARYGFQNETVIGLVARLSDVKGHIYLIEAFALIQDQFPLLRCVFFGEGPMESVLRAAVVEKGLVNKVFFYPVVNRTAELLGLFDIFVLPSLSEGLGLSLMEAQSAGLPVVASAVGGVLDIVEDGVTGYLVSPADSRALAGVLSKVLSDPAAALETGRRARSFICSRYSVRQMVEGTLNAYQAVL